MKCPTQSVLVLSVFYWNISEFIYVTEMGGMLVHIIIAKAIQQVIVASRWVIEILDSVKVSLNRAHFKENTLLKLPLRSLNIFTIVLKIIACGGE